MSRPELIVVDDSEAMLAFERAVLSDLYDVRTATSGRDALAFARERQPAAVLLDLSMPDMSGDEVLDVLRAEPALRDIPVVVVSSEVERGRRCLSRGAVEFLAKPVRPAELRSAVARVLDDAERRAARDRVAFLPLECGGARIGVALDGVERVLLQPATRPLPAGPPCMRAYVDLYGARVCVLDVPTRLRTAHARPVLDRKLVVVVTPAGKRVALCVDDVHEPFVIPRSQLLASAAAPSAAPAALERAVCGFVPTPAGPMPLVDVDALLPAGAFAELSGSARSSEVEHAQG